MDTLRNHQLAECAAKQHGVFTRSDAERASIPRSTVAHGVAHGRYLSAAPGVYVIAGSPPSLMQRVAIAVLSMPSLAAVSHQTAAEMWGLTSRGISTIEIVTRRWDRVPRPDVVVHESLDLVAADIVAANGVPVTSPARTIVDLGASNKWLVERGLEEGIRRRLFTLGDVQDIVDRVGRRGRRGVGVIRPLLEARTRWDNATDSALEDLFRKVIDTAGLPLPQPQYALRNEADAFVCRADFAYPERRILIELDSEAHHMDRVAFRRDRSKQNGAVTLGWMVLRYTWWDLESEPYRVVAEVRTALRRRQPAVLA